VAWGQPRRLPGAPRSRPLARIRGRSSRRRAGPRSRFTTGARAIAVPGDVADEDVTRLFAAAAELGPVTGMVNNAGITAHLSHLADVPVAVVRRVVEVNLLGSLLWARLATQVMSPARGGPGGAIVNVSSAAATLA
jgi:NAD(P)-dependent dehydrogenase (short-subunit alcohol dehydrogenase family)